MSGRELTDQLLWNYLRNNCSSPVPNIDLQRQPLSRRQRKACDVRGNGPDFPRPATAPGGAAGDYSISPGFHSRGAGRFIILPLSAARFTAESIREIRVKHEPGERHCVSPLISPLLGSGISEIQRIMEHRGIIFT